MKIVSREVKRILTKSITLLMFSLLLGIEPVATDEVEIISYAQR